MPRPKHNNRLSINAREWYSAAQLEVLGFGAFCCADRVALMLHTVDDWGIEVRERDDLKHGERNFARQRLEFRFKTRKRAKEIRDEMVRCDALYRLGGLDLHYWLGQCECSLDPADWNHTGKPTERDEYRTNWWQGGKLLDQIAATHTRKGKKR